MSALEQADTKVSDDRIAYVEAGHGTVAGLAAPLDIVYGGRQDQRDPQRVPKAAVLANRILRGAAVSGIWDGQPSRRGRGASRSAACTFR